MKIRNGFVSNSSSSSFLIYGICFEEEDTYKYVNAYNEYAGNEELHRLNGGYDRVMWHWITPKTGLSIYEREWCVYIGKSFDAIEMNQTRAEFQKEVEDTINKFFPGIQHNFCVYQDAWWNG